MRSSLRVMCDIQYWTKNGQRPSLPHPDASVGEPVVHLDVWVKPIEHRILLKRGSGRPNTVPELTHSSGTE